MLVAEPISRKRYAAYGDVIEASPELETTPANFGTATRFLGAAELLNHRPGRAEGHVSVYRCGPEMGPTVRIEVLERHAYSTQIFLPMTSASRYLVVVCPGTERPDLAAAQAFVVRSPVGISYRPGVWHHPMVALGREADLACFVFEDGGPDDCETVTLAEALSVAIPSETAPREQDR